MGNKTKRQTATSDDPVTNADPIIQQKRRISRKGTITKNPESLNAKLQTNAIVDPFFDKLNSFVGEMTCANRMLMNILPPHQGGNLGLSSPFWTASDRVGVHGNSGTLSKMNLINVPHVVDITNSMVRISNADYRMTADSYERYRFTT